VALGFAAAILCLAATVVVTTRLEATRDEQARLVHHTTQTLLALEALEAACRTAAISLDAQVDRGASWERELTRRSLDRIEPQLRQVEALVADEPGQAGRAAQLGPRIRRLAGQVQAALDDMGRGDRPGARAVLDGLGPQAMAPIDELFRGMVDAEAGALEHRQAAWRRAALTGAVAFGLATLALLVLILLAARLVRTEMQARERLLAERADMVALQQQLMAVVSHDLRSPLAAMKSAAALIVRDEAVDDDHREDARRVVSNARRMERLIRDLLDFSRVRAGHALPIHPDLADLVDLSRRAVSDLGRDAEGQVIVEGLGEVTGVWDANRLEQVVSNLVTNALKYGPAHRPVRIVVDGRGEGMILAVRDEGGGLPAAQHQAIFEPFRRAVSGDAEEHRSTGLGLYIVRRIVEAHGGTVEVASAPGDGTTFTVRLPRRTAPAAGPAAAGG
jgi:signal transduction histidine kinase